jgi:hypothetical protein
MAEEWEETKLGEGGEGDRRDISADRLRGRKEGTKIVVDYVDGGEVGMSRDNGVEEGIDGGKGGGVGSDFILYFDLVSSYCPPHSPLSQPIHYIPLLFDYSLEVGRVFSGADDRKEALEDDQELDELLFVRKRPLFAMLAARG